MVHKNQKLSVYEKKNLQETYDASRLPVTVKPKQKGLYIHNGKKVVNKK